MPGPIRIRLPRLLLFIPPIVQHVIYSTLRIQSAIALYGAILLAETSFDRRFVLIQPVIQCNDLQYLSRYAIVTAMLTKRKKENAIKGVRLHDTDTGSPDVQIAILSRRIEELASHLKGNHKDKHSRRGLLQMVAQRHKLIGYLKKKSVKRYRAVAKKAGLKVNA